MSPKKPPKKNTGKSPESSPTKPPIQRTGAPPGQGSHQPGPLFQSPFPDFKPYLARKTDKPSSSSTENSPSSSTRESVYSYPSLGFQTSPYVLNAQSSAVDHGSHAFSIAQTPVLAPYTGPSHLAQNGPTTQFGGVYVPQSQDGFPGGSLGPDKETSPESCDPSQALSEWGSPEIAAQQQLLTNDADIANQTVSLSLQTNENSTSDKCEAQVSQPAGTRSSSTTTASKTTLPTIQEGQKAPNTEQPSTSSSPTKSIDSLTTRPHRSSSLSTQSSTTPSPSPTTTVHPGITIIRQKPSGFFWQLDSHSFPCAAATCDQRCNLWDGASVICPRCGPYSEIRYCSKTHLLEDIESHWGVYCGQMAFSHPCRENSIPAAVRNAPVLVPCLQPCDTPERHRQAVCFNGWAQEGDYVVFSDLADMLKTGFSDATCAAKPLRCSSRIIHVVVFEDPGDKDRFRRVLAACLFFTIEVVDLIDYMYRLIRDNLRSKAVWNKDLEEALKYQLAKEFSVQIQPQITGERHACKSDWEGCSRRACRDMTCRGEYRRLLGKLGGMGYRRLLDYLEDGHWVLRAARTTHPGVSRMEARMRGEGFEGVLEEDRRLFCRGAGWDGAGSGEMEIEGVNV